MTATSETAMVQRSTQALAPGDSDGGWSIEQILAQKKKIQLCMKEVMHEGEHFGIVPGTSRKDDRGKELAKPTLFKAGAETLCFMFRLAPEYTILTAVETETKISYKVKCVLRHIPTGMVVAEGLGSCNSREAKYLRAAPKRCPLCGKETIFKSKLRDGEEGEPGWFCWRKKDGCGANFEAGDDSIEGQPSGIADPSDLDNTILKMACKRSNVAATLAGTAASDFFTQDLEDLTTSAAEYAPPPAAAAPNNIQRATDQQRTQEAEYTAARTAGDGAARFGSRESAAPKASTSVANSRRGPDSASGTTDTVEVIDGKTGEVSRQPRADEKQVKEILALANQMGLPLAQLGAELQKRYKVEGPSFLGRGQAIDWIRRCEQKVRAARGAVDAVREFAEPAPAAPARIGAEALGAIKGALQRLAWKADFLRIWLTDFGVTSIDELTARQGDIAYALLAAFGTPAYQRILDNYKAGKDEGDDVPF